MPFDPNIPKPIITKAFRKTFLDNNMKLHVVIRSIKQQYSTEEWNFIYIINMYNAHHEATKRGNGLLKWISVRAEGPGREIL